jgi:hypothetical protein
MQHLHEGYNWHTIRDGVHSGQATLRIFQQIHYLTSHAPRNIQKRWKQAEIRWRKRTKWHKSGINDRL